MNKILIQTYLLLHYSCHFPPRLMHVWGLLYNTAGSKLPTCCTLWLQVRDEIQCKKNKNLWGGGQTETVRARVPRALHKGRNCERMCAWQREFQNVQRGTFTCHELAVRCSVHVQSLICQTSNPFSAFKTLWTWPLHEEHINSPSHTYFYLPTWNSSKGF